MGGTTCWDKLEPKCRLIWEQRLNIHHRDTCVWMPLWSPIVEGEPLNTCKIWHLYNAFTHTDIIHGVRMLNNWIHKSRYYILALVMCDEGFRAWPNEILRNNDFYKEGTTWVRLGNYKFPKEALLERGC